MRKIVFFAVFVASVARGSDSDEVASLKERLTKAASDVVRLKSENRDLREKIKKDDAPDQVTGTKPYQQDSTPEKNDPATSDMRSLISRLIAFESDGKLTSATKTNERDAIRNEKKTYVFRATIQDIIDKKPRPPQTQSQLQRLTIQRKKTSIDPSDDEVIEIRCLCVFGDLDGTRYTTNIKIYSSKKPSESVKIGDTVTVRCVYLNSSSNTTPFTLKIKSHDIHLYMNNGEIITGQ